MRLIVEEVDGAIYGDIILTEHDIEQLRSDVLLEATSIVAMKRIYMGVRLGETWKHSEVYDIFKEDEGA